MSKFEEIIKRYEERTGAHVEYYHFECFYNDSYLDIHEAGAALTEWHRVNIDTEEEANVTAPEYYIAGRRIADDIVSNLLKWYDFAAVHDVDDFEEVVINAYRDEAERLEDTEDAEEARARVNRNHADVEHAISEACLDCIDMFDIMTDERGFCSLDRIALDSYDRDACADAVATMKKAIQDAIDAAHFSYTI